MSGPQGAAAEQAAREAVVAGVLECTRRGLNEGAAGNLSVRWGQGMLITPTGVLPEELRADALVRMGLDGSLEEAGAQPSSEWRFHRDIYVARADVQAVVHVHSPYATALACTRRGLPAFHYMVAVAGGADVRCAPYATFGSQGLSQFAVEALEGRMACLLANHGMIAVGGSLREALRVAAEVENLARQYCLSLAFGGPVLLEAGEMRVVVEKFRTYGKR